MKKLTILLLLALTACADKLSPEESFSLYYPSLTEICPGTNITLTPSWVGGSPGSFSITDIRYEGTTYETPCFSISEDSGAFSISESSDMPVGSYSVDICCIAGGKKHSFKDIISVTMMKSVPDGITVTPSDFQVKVSDIIEGKEDLPGAVITPDGEGFVQIKKYLIQNVYRDGVLVNECKPWFSLDENTGQFSVKSGNVDFVSGTYTFDFKLTTYKVGASDEAGLFQNALSVKAVAAPYALVYNPASRKVEVGTSVSSVAPSFLGTPDEAVFSIKEVTPEGGPSISIDPTSGILTIESPDDNLVGESYSVSVTVENPWGAADFADAFTFNIISFVHPITTLSYGDVSGIVSGRPFSNAPAEVDGDDVVFSLVDLPEELAMLSIDATTGTVSCSDGVKITPGTYTVSVKGQNDKASVTASFSLNIIPNPNEFTYVLWGNNLGLTPIAKYGNQFRLGPNDATLTCPILESDIPAGRPVKFTWENKSAMGNHGFAIQSNGTVVLTPRAQYRIWAHCIMITVQVGNDNDENKVIRKFPLFIDQNDYYSNGYKIEYTPFAVRINPHTGGKGPVPVIVDANNNPANQPTLDFRANPTWYNVNGPVQHKDGAINKDKTTFLKCVWDKYYTAIGSASNYGAWNPVSWWLNKDNGRIPYTGAYIDGANNLQLVVNPDRFVDDYGYGDGVMSCICVFALNGKSPLDAASSPIQVVPIFIWLDPSYNE